MNSNRANLVIRTLVVDSRWSKPKSTNQTRFVTFFLPSMTVGIDPHQSKARFFNLNLIDLISVVADPFDANSKIIHEVYV